ncbi:XdhC family protein [Herbiconiux sp. VKM Ac-1786]|uniref:XdhC family protein n=1 Tax=Herbiconiux sp. VKM Ac-1786 TaxID=2783824 RepID=UPI00188B16E6|nr:XdhC/CoxI family protein [Herbiconiux sp. VKM Ac-1786]MBF4574094.1 XdhC family protein [Herbiconiux sp. VKM Ac-1786]
MLELASALLDALAAGRHLAVATVIEVDGSAPRALGTSMAVDDLGRVIGSISGGCVEGAVYDACTAALASGATEICTFGFTDDDAFAVGLSCGGRLTVVVRPLGAGDGDAPLLDELRLARDGRAAGLALVLSPAGPVEVLTASGAAPDARRQRIRSELVAAVHRGRSARRTVDCDGELEQTVLLVSAPPARMIVFGAVDFSIALSNAAALLGYRVTVCDARPVFATAERFPAAEVVNRWPTDYLAETAVDERTVLCILTHDDKFDVPLIEAALGLDVAYVGAMGSRATHERRLGALRSHGVGEESLARLHSPIGLDLGASSPEETAVSILAEVIAARSRASGVPLRETSGAIHSASAAVSAASSSSDQIRSLL